MKADLEQEWELVSRCCLAGVDTEIVKNKPPKPLRDDQGRRMWQGPHFFEKRYRCKMCGRYTQEAPLFYEPSKEEE